MNDERPDAYARVKRLAQFLRQVRVQKNLSQAELAKRARLGASTINQLEKVALGGKLVGMPLPDTLRQIAFGLATDGLGEVHLEEYRRRHLELMMEIGYIDPPSPNVVILPHELIEKLARLGGVTVELGQTGRPWTPRDLANLERAIDQVIQLRRQQLNQSEELG